MIEISHLVKKYGDHIAVNDLTLTVEPGKIYGFLGPNGAGKSTTMNIITGYLGATSGEVKINGFDIFAQPEEAKKCLHREKHRTRQYPLQGSQHPAAGERQQRHHQRWSKQPHL